MKYILIILIVLIILFIVFVIHSCKKVEVSYFDIENEKIDKNMRIMLLSDLHNRNVKDKVDLIIKNEKPDIIVLSGDMVNEFAHEQQTFIDLTDSFIGYDTYYTFGNHEEALSDHLKSLFLKKLTRTNIVLLNNDSKSLSNNIMLYGLDVDITFFEGLRKKKINNEYIESKIGEIDKKKYNIAIAHNPLMAKEYDKYGFDLTLSGHVHGGIVRLPLLGGLLSPEYKFFPKYYQGVYDVGNMKLVVSRGLGFNKRFPIRLFNPAEVVIINLRKK